MHASTFVPCKHAFNIFVSEMKTTHIEDKNCFGKPLFGWLFLLFLLVSYYLVQRNVPYMSDDYLLQLTKETGEGGRTVFSDKLIGSVSELWNAIVRHREVYNGRLSDMFAMSALYLWGRDIFAVVNSIVACSFVSICAYLCFRKVNLISCAVTVLAFLFLLPNIPGTFLWLCGAFNYLWGGLFFCLFLFFYEKIKSGASGMGAKVAVIVLAFLASAVHEVLGGALLAMLVIDAGVRMLKTRKSVSYTEWLIVAASFLGVLLPMTASVLYSRIDGGIGASDSKKIQWMAYSLVFSIPVLFVFLVTLIRLKKDALFNHLTYFIFVSCLGLFALIFVAGGSGGDGGNRFYLSLATIILFLRTYEAFFVKYGKLLTCVSLACFFVWWYPIYSINVNADEIHRQIAGAEPVGRTIVIDTSDSPHCTEHQPLFLSLPYHIEECRHVWIYMKGEPFFVICNAFKTNRSLYAKYKSENPDEYHVFSDKDLTYIRLPKDTFFYHRRLIEVQNIETGQKGGFIPYAPLGPSTHLTSGLYYRFVKKFSFTNRMSCDFDGEFYYIVIKDLPPGNYSMQVKTYNIYESAHHIHSKVLINKI